MTITEFLLARIAEDEALASKLARFDKGHYSPGTQIYTGSAWVHSPLTTARVLAECATKRAIIGLAAKVEDAEDAMAREWATAEVLAPAILHALAAVYADHPDYRQEWQPV